MAFTLWFFFSWLCGRGYEYIFSGAGAPGPQFVFYKDREFV